MNQLTSIKERLRNFNDYEFQELCDSFLSLRNRGYKAYSRTGAHDVKQKTTRGTPDTLIQMPNGLYLFVECTTTKHKGKSLLKKLKGDISACLNVEKTKIHVSKIQEIILCYNSNLKADEIEDVNKQAVELMDKQPMHYSLDALAHEIFFHHKNLAHDYLGIHLDTGQVVSLDKFISEYDNGKQKLATPLAGAFLHRNKELENVRDKLTNDIVIISGPAGVGKSKLAIESIDQFVQSHLDYNAFAISPKGADLLGDLGAYFEGDESSILLVDDVNRVDKFEQILGFYRGLKKGKLKLVLTVRDYALENVSQWLSAYKNSIVKISKFENTEIIDVIEQEPFEILNGDYQNKINSIAKGNARLAVMMAMIAKKTNKLESLNNVSDLFEQYFESFVIAEDAFKHKRVLKALGILSFFHALPYNDGELLDEVANSFSISSDELREAFDRLHGLDLIELNYQHVKIGEQNLSTYFFYKVFIKDQLLSFESLWNHYFEKFEHRFKDTVYPMHQNFGKEFISEKIRPVLLSYWSMIKSDEDKAFRFLNFSWEFVPDECLVYLEERIDILAHSQVTELKTKYETNDFVGSASLEKHLHLLANFLTESTSFLDALELSFQCVKRSPEHLSQLIYHIDENCIFYDEDYINHFERHAILVDYLVGEVENGRLEALSFFAIAKTLLTKLHWSYASEKESKIDDSNIESVKESRRKVLNALCHIHIKYPEEVLAVMLDFSIGYKEKQKYTLGFDLLILIPWIDGNMLPSNFQHCYYVREMVRSSIKGGYKHDYFERLNANFVHPIYSLFELINWDRYRNKDDWDYEDFESFDRLKTSSIEKRLIFRSKYEIKQFITQYLEILEWREIKIHSQNHVVDAIIKANLAIDKEIGFETFVALARLQDKGTFNSGLFISYRSMDCLTIHSNLAEKFWKAIDLEGLNEIWKLEVLTSLPIKSITRGHLSRLYIVLNDMKRDFWIQLERLKKYKMIETKVLNEVLVTVVKKIEKESLRISLGKEFFVEVSDLVEDIEILKKAYVQQAELDDHFDYEGKALFVVLEKDNRFLIEYIKALFDKDTQERARDHREFAVIWNLPNGEELLYDVMEYMANVKTYYFISEHFVNVFFENLTDHAERADKYLLRLIEKYSDQVKIIKIAFNIIHTSRKTLFKTAFDIYIQKNQDVKSFREIKWTRNQIMYSGGAIVGEIQANKWKNLLDMVEKAKLGIKTRAIRNYIKSQIDGELRYAEHEKRRQFFSSW